MIELLKWMQALAVGVLGTVATYLQSLQPQGGTAAKPVVVGLVLLVLTRLVGFLLAKLGSAQPPVPPK